MLGDAAVRLSDLVKSVRRSCITVRFQVLHSYRSYNTIVTLFF